MLEYTKIVLLGLGLILINNYCLSVNANRVRYDNYHVYKVYPQNVNDLKFIEELEVFNKGIQILDYQRNLNTKIFKGLINFNVVVITIVSPSTQSSFIEHLTKRKIPNELVEKDLQKVLESETNTTIPSTFSKYRSENAYDWTRYHTLKENYEWLQSLPQRYPGQVKLLKGGKSHQGRDILGVKLSYKEGNKGVFIEGGIHAREWISPATVTYILNELLTSKDSQVRQIAENYDWYIFPHFNPDGYVYSHNNDRFWRKNRSRQTFCNGVDLNRNWDFHWREVGASGFPCSQTFAGTNAFSEIESLTMSQFLVGLKNNLRVYLSFHSYSQLLLYPYGHTNENVKNQKDLQKIGDAAAKGLSCRYGTLYEVGSVNKVIYATAGASMDWAYGFLGIPLSFTYELRPGSGSWNGFVLPPEQIIPTGEETLDSLVALVNEAEKLGYFK